MLLGQSIDNGIKAKQINAKAVPAFSKLFEFDAIDANVFAAFAINQVNKVIERTKKMSKASTTNPNFKHKQVKVVVKPLF